MTKISHIAAAVIAAGIAFTAAPSFAADTDVSAWLASRDKALDQQLEAKTVSAAFINSWLATRHTTLARTLEAKTPVTFAFFGNRIVPVYLNNVTLQAI